MTTSLEWRLRGCLPLNWDLLDYCEFAKHKNDIDGETWSGLHPGMNRKWLMNWHEILYHRIIISWFPKYFISVHIYIPIDFVISPNLMNISFPYCIHLSSICLMIEITSTVTYFSKFLLQGSFKIWCFHANKYKRWN